jgi:hypothetical protein
MVDTSQSFNAKVELYGAPAVLPLISSVFWQNFVNTLQESMKLSEWTNENNSFLAEMFG